MSQKHELNSVVGLRVRRLAAWSLGALAASGVLGMTRAAEAQQRFGSKGQLAITGEDLFGFSTETVKTEVVNGKVSDTSTRTSLFLTSRVGDEVIVGPRIGIHYFIIPNLSIGGTLGFDSRGGSRTTPLPNGATQTAEKDDSTSWVFLPKVGYTFMFSDVFGFWFRGGIGYAQDTTYTDPNNNNARQKLSFWFLSLDAPFIISPVPHFAFYVGPGLEASFAGTYSATNGQGTTVSWGASAFHLNLAAGLIGYFDL
jgi:hypothetical protein